MSRKITELKRKVEDLTAERDAAVSNGAALGQGGRAKNRFFVPDDLGDDEKGVRPADEVSDKHDDGDANNLDAGMKRVLGDEPQANVLFRRLTGLALTELTELSCCTTKRITVMWNTARFDRNGRHMGKRRLGRVTSTEPAVTNSSLVASSGRRRHFVSQRCRLPTPSPRGTTPTAEMTTKSDAVCARPGRQDSSRILASIDQKEVFSKAARTTGPTRLRSRQPPKRKNAAKSGARRRRPIRRQIDEYVYKCSD
jgi:hypothetical protein